MSIETPDRRPEKTRDAIRSAFFNLLMERGFAALRVSDVAARANVGRSTFYEHFRTKHDLLTESLSGPFSGLAGIIGSDQPAETLVPLLQHFRQNQALGRELFLLSTRPLMTRALTDMVEARLRVLCGLANEADPIVPLGLLAAQIAEAQLAVLENWSLGRVACSVDRIAQALFAGTNGAASALLRCPLPLRRHPTP